jgi:hypothetical protein
VTDPDADPAFVRALERRHGDPRYPPHIRALRVVDVSPLMTPEVQYVLDDHLTARGHELIADAVIAALQPSAASGGWDRWARRLGGVGPTGAQRRPPHQAHGPITPTRP